jgi:hypothetical protein
MEGRTRKNIVEMEEEELWKTDVDADSQLVAR